jgi:aspartate carbamoyltransferase catalytic subunit
MQTAEAPFPHRHLLGIEGLSPDDINHVLDFADGYVELNRQADKKRALLRGRTIINCFFENSTPAPRSRSPASGSAAM